MHIIQTTNVRKFGTNPLMPQDYISRIKILISNPQVPNKKNLTQKILTTDMRDSKSWTEILIFNHYLSGPMKSYNEFFFTHKDLFAIKKSPFIKFIIKFIVYDKLSIKKKRTITVP